MIEMLESAELEELVDDVERLYDDFEYFGQNCIHIATKQKDVIPFKLSSTQKIMHKYFCILEELGWPIRVIALKARQVMFTTYGEAQVYWRMWKTAKPELAMHIGDKDKTTKSMRTMYEMMHNKNPFNKKILGTEFFKYADSEAYNLFLSALSDRVGQSYTPYHILATEVPYYMYGMDVAASLFSVQPDNVGSIGLKEGTANSYDPYFHPEWVDAIDHVEELCKRHGAKSLDDLLFNKRIWDGSWLPVFIPFHIVPEYRRNPDTEGVHQNNLTDEELAGIETYGWDEFVIAWRRFWIRSKLKGDVAKFKQEFPASWKQAFQFGGGNRPFFNVGTTEYYFQRSTEILAGKYAPKMQMHQCATKWKVHPTFDERGHCTNKGKIEAVAYIPRSGRMDSILWKTPKLTTHANRYCMGIDVSEGLAQGDFHHGWVMDRVVGEVVYEFHSRIGYEYVAEELVRIAVYYGNAYMLIEFQGNGSSVISDVRKIYPDKYVLKDKKENQNHQVERFGHYTDAVNKRYILGLAREFVESHPEAMLFRTFWSEAQTFTESADGRKLEAEGKSKHPEVKNFDDSVMSLGLTLRANELAPHPQRVTPYSIREQQIHGRKSPIITNLTGGRYI